MRQKPGEPLPDFIDRVQQSFHHKLLAEDLQDKFVKLLVWEGMNTDHHTACMGLRERSLSRWVVASQGVTWPISHKTLYIIVVVICSSFHLEELPPLRLQ